MATCLTLTSRFEIGQLARNACLVALVSTGVFFANPGKSRAQTIVADGWDLLQTTDGTTFAGAPFTGVQLGTFDFGAPYGVQGVGNADTIVHRLSDATIGGISGTAAPIPIELVALQLVSVAPIDLGAGVGLYYITLQSTRGGPASPGQMTVTFDNPSGGTFDSFFDVFFDVRFGALNGPIAFSNNLTLSSSGTPWSRTPPAGAIQIPGVNLNLNGVNPNADFWPGKITEQHPSGATHVAITASPEPSSVVLIAFGALALLSHTTLRRRSACARLISARAGNV